MWRVGWDLGARTHIERRWRAQRYFKLSSSCTVALFLRYRAAWDNKHVCVCVLRDSIRDILNIILNTGNCTSVLIRCARSRVCGARPTIRVKTRTAGRSGPRSPRRRPARAGRGRDQSDGPSGRRRGAVRASFMFPRRSSFVTRSQLCGLCVFALASLFQERGLPRNYRVAYARC